MMDPWIKTKIEALEMFCYTGWSLLMPWKHGDGFSEVHASTLNN
jgi:hypothetical protein